MVERDYDNTMKAIESKKNLNPDQEKMLVSKAEDDRTEIQIKLGNLGLLNEATEVLQSTNSNVVTSALRLCCAMFAGGNRDLQVESSPFA